MEKRELAKIIAEYFPEASFFLQNVHSRMHSLNNLIEYDALSVRGCFENWCSETCLTFCWPWASISNQRQKRKVGQGDQVENETFLFDVSKPLQ